jgi:hypothetical protein
LGEFAVILREDERQPTPPLRGGSNRADQSHEQQTLMGAEMLKVSLVVMFLAVMATFTLAASAIPAPVAESAAAK